MRSAKIPLTTCAVAVPGPLVPLLMMMSVLLKPMSHLAEALSALATCAPVLKLKSVNFLVTPIG